MKKWGQMLYPATPHLAEEWNHIIGENTLLAETVIINDSENDNDIVTLAAESTLRNLIDNARNVKGLAERHANSPLTKLVIQTSPKWKIQLMLEAIELHAQNFDFMKEGQSFIQSHTLFQDDSKRGDVMQYWRMLTIGSKKSRGRVFTLTEGERILITSGFDEADYILKSAGFISETIDVLAVAVYAAGTEEDIAGKAKFAVPLQPGLAFL
tara:strand:- start:789 stop:1421 length:633 start_codon:yes stop_codon:yes gene_type:complete